MKKRPKAAPAPEPLSVLPGTDLQAPAPWLMLLECRAPWEYAAMLASMDDAVGVGVSEGVESLVEHVKEHFACDAVRRGGAQMLAFKVF